MAKGNSFELRDTLETYQNHQSCQNVLIQLHASPSIKCLQAEQLMHFSILMCKEPFFSILQGHHF